MTNSNQLDFHEPTLQQVADLCSQFGFTCAGEADLACLRAVLREGFSRWGRPAPAPAGEVAKLVQPPGRAGLTWQGVIDGLRDVLNDESEDAIQRVWQRSRILDAISVMEANPCPAPVPVAVSERLPGPEDCDAEGRCWMGYGENEINGLGHLRKTWFWTLEDLSMVDEYTHWRPYNTMPLPSGEVAP